MNHSLPELLAPAGSPAALEAAVAGGADAVYLGGRMLNARMNAANFDDRQMKDAVSFAHRQGVRLYVTLNTAVLDREMDEVVRYAAFLYGVGIDALIVADLGLASLLTKYLPDFPLHASTQASGHNTDAARFLAERGFTRMVAARELPEPMLRQLCADSPIEIEAFIHGAHCVSHSGQCLMSWVQGGRSGNRGECAQPCRMKYNGGYPLSLRDLTLSAHVPALIDMGVRSLKIEGRMKSPDYVYGVTRIWRRLLDEGRCANEAEESALARLFSRSGFTDGYFTEHISPAMLGVRTEADKDASKAQSAPRVRTGGRQLPPIVLSRTEPVLPEVLREKPEKLRDLTRSTAVFRTAAQIPADCRCDLTALPLDAWKPGKANAVLLPQVIYDRDRAAVLEKLKAAKETGAVHALVGNIGHIVLASETGLTLHGTFRFNIMNRETCALLTGAGLADLTLSPELTIPQIRDLVRYYPASVIAYGRLPVMLLEKPVGAESLTDRTGARFPVIRTAGRDLVLNAVPTSMLGEKKSKLRDAGVCRRTWLFTTENAGQIADALSGKETAGAAYRRIQ